MRRLAVAWLALAGCSSGSGSTSMADMAQPSLLEVCEMVATAQQTRQLTCGGVNMSFPLRVYAVADCKRAQRQADAGYLTLDRTKLADCLAAVQAQPCADGQLNKFPEPAACAALYVPQSAAGAPCFDAHACQSGTSCYNSQCPGVCQKLRGAGEPCDLGCAPPLQCNYGGTPTCVMPAQTGESCVSLPCAAELYCDSSMAPAQTCKPRKTAGTICQATYDDCQVGLQCNNGVCGVAPKLGQACGAMARCGFGLVCDETTSLCVLWRGDNGVCHGEPDCAPDFICTTPGGGDGTCVKWIEEAASCDPNQYRCRMPAVCASGTCRVTSDCS